MNGLALLLARDGSGSDPFAGDDFGAPRSLGFIN